MSVRRFLPGLVGLILLPSIAAAGASFPATVLERHGFWGTAPNDTCCEARLAGWGPKGQPVVLSSGWDQNQESFRFALDIHDPAKDEPEELLSQEAFRDDESLPFACRTKEPILRCLWKSKEAKIKAIFAKFKIRPASGAKYLGLPPYEVDWVQKPASNEPPMAFDQTPNGLVFHLPDTSLPGYHLLPLGMVRSTSPHARIMVMRLNSWDKYDDAPIERGVRFVAMPTSDPHPRRKR